MTFDEILDQIIILLKRQGRVSYSALRRRFDLDNTFLDDLKDEILYVHEADVEADDRGFTWIGEAQDKQLSTSQPAPTPQPRPEQQVQPIQTEPDHVEPPTPDAERRPKTRRPPGYTVGQLFAVALIQNRCPGWGRKRVHATLSKWHQHTHREGDSVGFLTTELSFLASQILPSESTVGRMLRIIRSRCPFCEGPKGRRRADDSLVDSRFRRTEGHTSLGCTWSVMRLPSELFDQRLPLARLREIVRQSKAEGFRKKGKTSASDLRNREQMDAAERVVDRALMDQQIELLMRQIEEE